MTHAATFSSNFAALPQFRVAQSWPDRLVFVCFGMISVHFIDAATFHAQHNASLVERVLQLVAALAAGPALALAYLLATRTSRGVLAIAAGIPALSVGIGIHIIGIARNGWGSGDATGVLMAVAGAGLIVIGWGTLEAAIRRWRYRLLTLPLAIPFILFVLIPGTMVVFVTHASRYEIRPVDLGAPYETVSFATDDGVTIRGWYVPSRNGAAVMVVHGSGGARIRPLDHARMLISAGYGVLLYDTRGHGESGGTTNALGWEGDRDARAALAYLSDRDDVEPGRVGILGLSMGAEIAIDAAASGGNFGAVVADGAGVRSLRELATLDSRPEKYLELPVMVAMTAGTTLLTGETPPLPLTGQVKNITSPVLYISSNLGDERDLNRKWFDRTTAPKDLWEIDAGHTQGLNAHPDAYQARVLGWFDTHLLQQAR